MVSLRSLIAPFEHAGRRQDLVEAVLLGASSRFPLGTNVFERDWDLLVVLDTCRYDALARVAPEFDFLGDVGAITSVGSSTREWTANTFTNRFQDEIDRTALVSGNLKVRLTLEGGDAQESPLARRFTDWDIVDSDSFLVFDPVEAYAPVEPFGGILTPDIITDRAISVGRSYDADRLIVHYLPPHKPYRANAFAEKRPLEPFEYRPFVYLRNGGDRDVVWNAYLDELRWVLTHVGILLENVDAETAVITADHGDLFGRLGLYHHPTGVPHPRLRRVPWIETSATDTGEYEPHFDKPDRFGTDDADARTATLKHLGYL